MLGRTTRSGTSSGAGVRADLRLRRDSVPDLDADSTDSPDSTESERHDPRTIKEGALPRSKEKPIEKCLSRSACCIIVVLIGVLIFFSLGKTDNRSAQLKESIRNAQKEFPAQSGETWGGILSILESVVSGGSACPKSFLLLDKGDEQSRATSACLVAKVANSSSHIMKGADPLKLSSEELGNLTNIVNTIKNHEVIVIEHLENLPAESAKSLHFICDEHDDSFGKAAYFLTLTVKNAKGSPTVSAESTLRSLWPEMEWDYKEALIARITSLAVFVNPEASIKC